MNKTKLILTLIPMLFIGFTDWSLAQQTEYIPSNERSNFNAVRKSAMDGNQLRATYHNSGYGGTVNRGQNPDEFAYEFPINTNRFYMLFNIIFIGAEVQDQQTGNNLPIVNVSALRTDFDGSSWTMNPIVGYQRDDSPEVARSDRGPDSPLGNTWPDSWPDKFLDGGDGWAGSWNGFFGRDQFNADVEFYYKAGDDLYDRRSRSGAFVPDSTDPTRGGLALIMDSRILAWSIPLLSGTHFQIYQVQNDGTENYEKVAFGVWIADQVGNNSANDRPVFDNIASIAYIVDGNRDSEPDLFEDFIGEMGLQFLETPGNASDGIDNDADSFSYGSGNPRFPIGVNADLYSALLTENGGFYSQSERDSIIQVFDASDFLSREIAVGDKIVRILSDGSRVIDTYTGQPFTSQGRIYDFGGGTVTRIEDLLDGSDPNADQNNDVLDNDFDGLIDENQPNHLTKTILLPDGTSEPVAVSFINYLHFNVGDTIQQGLIVPNSVIRSRIASDNTFADLVNTQFSGRFINRFTAAPMIDEGRDDFFDNDQDWIASSDDTGIEGDGRSVGAGDGFPSSGAGTSFPGEQSIDKTDVSETDLIGITKVTIFGENVLQTRQDSDNWNTYLAPGEFETDPLSPADIFVSSGTFPLRQGSSERFALAISAVQTNGSAEDDRFTLNNNLGEALKAYAADYQFARAPSPPIVNAVVRDGVVTLYWDDSAEESFDRFIDDITGNTGQGRDFHGYKVYRSVDPSFDSVEEITDALGNFLYYTPRAIYDRADGVNGLHPIPINGTQFNQGNDAGLQYSFVDTTVTNGRTYFYAVTSFDYGLASAGIPPSESPIQISANPDGSFILGQNVVRVVPTETVAGYIDPDTPQATLISGSPGGTVNVEIIDAEELVGDNMYRVVFEDTLVSGGVNPDTLKTKNFSLLNITTAEVDTLIGRSEMFNGEELPETQGFRIRLQNEPRLRINTTRTGWVTDREVDIHRQDVLSRGAPKVADYEVIITENVGGGESIEFTFDNNGRLVTLPAQSTNFRIFNTLTNEEIQYGFADLHNSGTAGELSAGVDIFGTSSDVVFFVEDFREIEDTLTYQLQFFPIRDGDTVLSSDPAFGDTLRIFTTKPFVEGDVFEFRINPENLPRVDQDTARSQLDEILVIPNPYIVANSYEAFPPGTSRQQNRVLRFTNIPVPSTLRIFTSRGVIVREIEIREGDPRIEGGRFGGAYRWDMLTRDNLEIAYGVYIYQIDAPGIGTKTGKFAVIK